MADWPTSWESSLLRQAGIDITQGAIDLLAAWARSTPTEPWTNNPLGMPAQPGKYGPALPTRYAIFPSASVFRLEFARFLNTTPGNKVVSALLEPAAATDLWHAVHVLKWPGNDTETDYPSVVLDMTAQSYRDHVKAAAKADRKTSGRMLQSSTIQDATRNYAQSSTRTSGVFGDASKAINAMIRKGSGNGR